MPGSRTSACPPTSVGLVTVPVSPPTKLPGRVSGDRWRPPSPDPGVLYLLSPVKGAAVLGSACGPRVFQTADGRPW